MKNIFIFSVFLLSSTSLDAMMQEPIFPEEIMTSILVRACPSLDLPEYKQTLNSYGILAERDKIKIKLSLVVQEIISLRCVNSENNTYIAKNIASILCLDQTNRDRFLIRSLQAKVPYFIKIAVAYGANCNAVYPSNGFTALVYAAEDNNYQACSLLLSKGADVNLQRQIPKTWHADCYNRSDWPIYWPIQMAVEKGDAKMITLFAQAGAKLCVVIDYKSLLFKAIDRNEPEIVKALLDYDADGGYNNFSGMYGIKAAFDQSLTMPTPSPYSIIMKETSVTRLDKNGQIVELLRQAQDNLGQLKLKQD